MPNTCPYDPTTVPGCVSMHHCPICGDMVIAGMPHFYSEDLDDLDPNNRSDADLALRMTELRQEITDDSAE